MSPLRILILVGLFYLLFRLLVGAGKRHQVAGESEAAGSTAGAAQDILMEDPVCRTLIPARQAISWTNNGKTLYFCSEGCRSKFITSQGDQQA